jgi:TolB-like protein/DNA-binding winged helix-turn-helix (wHTH) protein
MQRSTRTALRIGDWRVDPISGEIARNGQPSRVELRTMRLLECLAEHAGETVSIDELLNRVWPDVTVSPDSVYQAVATLRRTLGDDPKNPIYIATVPRLGYRLVAAVGPWDDEPVASMTAPAASVPGASPEVAPQGAGSRLRSRLLWAGAAVIVALLAAGFFFRERLAVRRTTSAIAAPAPAQKSVAVLPFLDLTEGMKNEEFADGMTEELIDKLSKVPGLRVPSATAAFFFKNKQVAPGDIAKSLGVGYVLDGSVRKSGQRLRVAARLMRADNGYVTWSETYDRPVDDLLMVQDDIAGDVTKALTQSIEGPQ